MSSTLLSQHTKEVIIICRVQAWLTDILDIQCCTDAMTKCHCVQKFVNDENDMPLTAVGVVY